MLLHRFSFLHFESWRHICKKGAGTMLVELKSVWQKVYISSILPVRLPGRSIKLFMWSGLHHLSLSFSAAASRVPFTPGPPKIKLYEVGEG